MAKKLRAQVEALEDRTVPATINVTTFADVVNPNDGRVSLREAIARANATAAPDTIVLRAGLYKIARPYNPNNPDVNATGSFDVLRSATLVGAGAGKTVIDGAQIDRVFAVTGTAAAPIGVTFQGLTVRGGKVGGDGGGILMSRADVTLLNCVVAGNEAVAGHGGGVSNAPARGTGNLTLVRTTVTDNKATGSGGGVFLKNDLLFRGSMLRVEQSVFARNTAGVSGGGIEADVARLAGSTLVANKSGNSGGGLHAGTATLINCLVGGNAAVSGGGVALGTGTLSGCTVRGNTATVYGGGITVITGTLTNSTVDGNASSLDGGGIMCTSVTLINSTVSRNRAQNSGGGIHSLGTATLTNSTVSTNLALQEGGGIAAFGMNLLNCTVTRNEAPKGGGLMHYSGKPATLKNTIVARNHAYGGPALGYDIAGDLYTSGGHNLIGDGSGGFTNGVNGDRVGTAQNYLDPMLGGLQNNGGPTQTHALLAGSLAIDGGENTGSPTTDQRGVGRPRDGDGNGSLVIDIGAFEI